MKLKITLLSFQWLVLRILLEMELLMLLLDAMKEVSELEWSLVTTKLPPLLLPKKLEFFLKIGNQLREIALLCKVNNSENSLVVFRKKEKVMIKLNLLEILKTLNRLEINFVSWLDHLLMTNISLLPV